MGKTFKYCLRSQNASGFSASASGNSIVCQGLFSGVFSITMCNKTVLLVPGNQHVWRCYASIKASYKVD